MLVSFVFFSLSITRAAGDGGLFWEPNFLPLSILESLNQRAMYTSQHLPLATTFKILLHDEVSLIGSQGQRKRCGL